MSEKKVKSTKFDKITDRLDTIVERTDSIATRLDDTNVRIDGMNKDLCQKIDNLKDDFDTQFSNHLSEHDSFRKHTLKVVKWVVAPTGGVGVVIGILKLFGVF